MASLRVAAEVINSWRSKESYWIICLLIKKEKESLEIKQLSSELQYSERQVKAFKQSICNHRELSRVDTGRPFREHFCFMMKGREERNRDSVDFSDTFSEFGEGWLEIPVSCSNKQVNPGDQDKIKMATKCQKFSSALLWWIHKFWERIISQELRIHIELSF